MSENLTRPIIGIENRTAQEVFDIMCARFTRAQQAGEPKPVAWRIQELNGPWMVSTDPLFVRLWSDHGWKVEPLFTHTPKADPDVVRLVEAARLARRYAGVAIASATGRSPASAEEQLHNDLASIDAALATFSALGEG